MICAWGERPFLGFMRWWTTRGLFKDERGHVFYGMFKTFCQNVNERLIPLFDRGYAHLATLERLDKFQQDGIIRWKSNLLLIPCTNESFGIKNANSLEALLLPIQLSSILKWKTQKTQKTKFTTSSWPEIPKIKGKLPCIYSPRLK